MYSDQMTSGAGWSVNVDGSDTVQTFNYDYSADGIPEAPNSHAGDAAQRGLKLEANVSSESFNEMSVYPVGQSFTGSYQLRFDAWMNFDADEVFNGISEGTTEFGGGGVGYDGTAPGLGTNSGVLGIASGDGGSASDWRAFKGDYFLAEAEMAAGSRNGSDPYYADFLPAVEPPATQAQGAVTSRPGSPGFQWVTWQFTVINDGLQNIVSLDIEKPGGDLLNIFEVDCDDATNGCSNQGNIRLYYADWFTSVSPVPSRTFGLFDNVVVRDIPTPSVPLPAGAVLMLSAAGAFGLAARRRSRGA